MTALKETNKASLLPTSVSNLLSSIKSKFSQGATTNKAKRQQQPSIQPTPESPYVDERYSRKKDDTDNDEVLLDSAGSSQRKNADADVDVDVDVDASSNRLSRRC